MSFFCLPLEDVGQLFGILSPLISLSKRYTLSGCTLLEHYRSVRFIRANNTLFATTIKNRGITAAKEGIHTMSAFSPHHCGEDASLEYLGPLPTRRTKHTQQQPQEHPPNKLLNVTITILSLTGMLFKESSKKKASYKSKFTRELSAANDCHQTSTASAVHLPTTTVVASFQRTVEANELNNNGKTIMTHIPSLPLSLPSKNSSTFKQEILWPTQDSGTHSKLSSFTFQRYFPREDDNTFANTDDNNNNSSSSIEYTPQLCPIQISISRNGKMYKMGSAHLLINGNEFDSIDGGAMIKELPVVNFENVFKSATTSLSRRSSSRGGDSVNLMRLKGDTLKAGIGERATLRVLVRVVDPLSTTQVNYGLAEKKSTAEQATTLSANSSYEYDPVQEAVVLKKKNKTLDGYLEENNSKNNEKENGKALSPPSVLFTNNRSGKRSEVARNNKASYTNDDDAQSQTTGASSYTDDFYSHANSSTVDDNSADNCTSVASSHSSRSNDYHTDDCSLYSKSSAELLKMINDISKNRSLNDDTVTMSSSVQSYQKKRVANGKGMTNKTSTERQMQQRLVTNYSTTSSLATTSTTSTGSSDDSFLQQYSKPSLGCKRATSMFPRVNINKNHWSRRFVCCGSGSTSGFGNIISTKRRNDNDDVVLASIHEDSVVSMYSLNGRENSLQQTIDTEHTPW